MKRAQISFNSNLPQQNETKHVDEIEFLYTNLFIIKTGLTVCGVYKSIKAMKKKKQNSTRNELFKNSLYLRRK